MTQVREIRPKIGIVADDTGAVRVPVVERATSRPRTLDAMWNLVEDLAKENAELRGSIDIVVGRLSVLEAWVPRKTGTLLEMGDDE